jgi:hypothetical protein
LHDNIPSKHGAKFLMLIYIPRKYYELWHAAWWGLRNQAKCLWESPTKNSYSR